LETKVGRAPPLLSMYKIGMNRSPHILIVEDDREIRTMVSRFLQKRECRVSTAESGRIMDGILKAAKIDLVVLDIMLPGEDGLSICRRLRSTTSIPIIMLTAAGDAVAKIVGLEMGADDYVAKPFDPNELLARIRAVLRRVSALPPLTVPTQTVLRFAEWSVFPIARELRNGVGTRVTLTSAEFELLLAFCNYAQQTLTRDQLLDLTQGRAAIGIDRSVDILVSRLRRKIELDPKDPLFIKTVRSGGYVFTPKVVSE
jgi:two-component system OmpR family response regulator